MIFKIKNIFLRKGPEIFSIYLLYVIKKEIFWLGDFLEKYKVVCSLDLTPTTSNSDLI